MHEQSITFQLRSGDNKGKWVNTPGIHKGKKISEDQAHSMHLKGDLPALGGAYYDSVDTAVDAARTRSNMLGIQDLLDLQKPQEKE